MRQTPLRSPLPSPSRLPLPPAPSQPLPLAVLGRRRTVGPRSCGVPAWPPALPLLPQPRRRSLRRRTPTPRASPIAQPLPFASAYVTAPRRLGGPGLGLALAPASEVSSSGLHSPATPSVHHCGVHLLQDAAMMDAPRVFDEMHVWSVTISNIFFFFTCFMPFCSVLQPLFFLFDSICMIPKSTCSSVMLS